MEKDLARIYYKNNRTQNRILAAVIAISIFLLYSAFSIAYGKIRSDYLIDVRAMGTLATVSLENGSMKQYRQMEALPYIDMLGIRKTAMTANCLDLWNGNLIYLDDNAYEKMAKPAYTDIAGHYPRKEDEIMFSTGYLLQMGISSPKLDMPITLNLKASDGTNETKEFRLCGYFTDYIDPAINEPEAYISKDFIDKRNISPFPADKILAIHSSLREGKRIENSLYSDLEMEYDSQQVFGENPMVLQSVRGVFGSIPIAACSAAIVVLSAFMLIYNVISISVGKEIQEYGLLKVLGTTNRQLKRMAYRQNIWNIAKGILFGQTAGAIFVKLFLGSILQHLYMKGLGKSDVSGFYPLFLVLVSVLISATAFFAGRLALKQVIKWNAIDSVRYVHADISYPKKKIETKSNTTIAKLAWRNITRVKKRFIISLVSITLGCITALGAAVIMAGTDISNEINELPDFQMGILSGIFRFPDKVPSEINDQTQWLSPANLDIILNMEGIEKESIKCVRGSYAVIDFNQDPALLPRKESIDYSDETVVFATLQIVDEAYLAQLEQYVSDCSAAADIDSVKKGSGCILLHYHELSKVLNDKAADVLGMPIHFYSLDAYGADSMNAYEKGSLDCSGYLDFTDEAFPKLQTTSLGNKTNYFIMTQEAFEHLGFPEKIFDISFDASDHYKTEIHQKLSQIVQNENKASAMMDTFYLSANYTLLLEHKDRIYTANIILGVLIAVILLNGITNYAATLLANQTMRKKELAVMESIGLTRDQLWKMLFLEGFYYWLILLLNLLTLGTGSLWILGNAIRKKLLYFQFFYPWQAMLVLGILLLLICLALAGIMYRTNRKQTMRERLSLL